MNYYLCDKVDNNFNAGSKAVMDANAILIKNGFSPLVLGYRGGKNIVHQYFLLITRLVALILKLRKNDTVFIQYPIPLNNTIRPILYKILSLKKAKVQILIHDLPSIRFDFINNEDSILSDADLVICHTERMKDHLVKIGVNGSKIKLLYLFDYLTTYTNIHDSEFGNSVIYAGNLEKSVFVKYLDELTDTEYLLYGLPAMPEKIAENVKYMGKFHPDDISDLKGDWGLVWDGDSIATCSGSLGEYLKFNSSHKLSLYIAANKPVIIWSESSLKDFVLDNRLGICVSSLDEIGSEIAKLTEEEKKAMKESISDFSHRLRHGYMLNNIVSSI